MKKIHGLIGIVAVAYTAGCAKSPESISPAYVSPVQYRALDCDQLGQESSRVDMALSIASKQQRDARSNDIVGVILIGLPVSTLSGGNVAAQVAALKGQKQTLEKVMIEKRCVKPAVVAAPPPPPGSEGGKSPKCSDVGGYEAYKKKTGNICSL